MHFEFKVEGLEEVHYENSKPNKGDVTILIANKVDFKTSVQ
jgi:hypothetical protein